MNMAMNSKHKNKHIAVFGQRSLASSLRSIPSCGDSQKASANERVAKNPGAVSLSDFLHRKLNKTSAPFGTVEGKSTPFLSPVGFAGVSVDGNIESKKHSEGARTGHVSEKVILDQFKHFDAGDGDFVGSCGVDEEENSNNDNVLLKESRRGNPLQVEEESHYKRKQVVVLGGNSQLRQKRKDVGFGGRDYLENGGLEGKIGRRNINIDGGLSQLKGERKKESFFESKKMKPSYNHYENGSGWWNSKMEGVDNEEVGFNEVWEGVGSTTLGGIEWH